MSEQDFDDDPEQVYGDVLCPTCKTPAHERLLIKQRTTRNDMFPHSGAKTHAEYLMPCGHLVAGWRFYYPGSGWSHYIRWAALDWQPWDERTKP